MSNTRKFYINGEWVEPIGSDTVDVINPATEDAIGTIALGTHEDVDVAVAAAQNAFKTFSQTSVEERLELLNKITEIIGSRSEDLATAITSEMGAPNGLAKAAQAGTGLFHFATTAGILANFSFEEELGTSLIVKEPVGVVGMITPWNWPINQIACKVAPALAAGCTMVLKPSEVAPLNAIIFAEVMHEAGVPPGVFNLVNGDGPTVGAYLSSHAGIDMMSFTGSTRAGIEVARNAAATVKRVAQELGGKSANIILDDANLEEAVVADPETHIPVPKDGKTMGEILIRGNVVMKGYYKNKEATELSMRNGWFHSGDLAVVYPDGYIQIKDRSKDIIISGGENISSVEVENVVAKHPAVSLVAVVAKPDEKWGETPCAFVELAPGKEASSDEIISFCKENMAGFKRPKYVIFGELPKTSTGKIQKFELRKKAKEI